MPLFLLTALGWGKSAFGAVITFCSKPPGSWIAAAVALSLGLWWYGQHEFNRGEAKCEAAHAEAAANERARQAKVFVDADTRAVARSVISEQKDTDNQKRVANVKVEAAAMPGASDVCIDASIADELRSIN